MNTFKDSLTKEANERLDNFNINKDMEEIKSRMKKYVETRCFTISLIRVKPGHQYAIGRNYSNNYEAFIPGLIPPAQYRQLFVEQLQQLGFNNIKFNDYNFPEGDIFDIKVEW